jgi:hypothetical protein
MLYCLVLATRCYLLLAALTLAIYDLSEKELGLRAFTRNGLDIFCATPATITNQGTATFTEPRLAWDTWL